MQQFNALLYGAVGLQNYNVFNGALTADGERGPLFWITKELNARSYQWGKTLMALTSTGVFHSPEVLRDRPDFAAFRQPIDDSAVLAETLPFRCSAGEFEDGESNRYLLVLNRDYEVKRSFELKLKKAFRIYAVSGEDGAQRVRDERAETLKVALQPGDAALLRFQDADEQAYAIDYVLKK